MKTKHSSHSKERNYQFYLLFLLLKKKKYFDKTYLFLMKIKNNAFVNKMKMSLKVEDF